MSKTILIEKRMGSLKYVKEAVSDGSSRIGRLEGIAADFKNPTRNGRRYPLELWKNVMNSDDYKEGMETHTILGENDHPETRVDTSIKEVSIVLTDLTIDENEGVLNAGFDILPTEEGYKLKALLDYGCQIGVSSRGLGDEIQQNGETIIDPDTYVFYAFDAVIMPAVKSARPAVVESADRQKLVDKFHKDIESATTVNELESLKNVANVTNMPELDSLVESIDIKLNSLTEGNNISSKLEADLGVLAQENEDLKSKVADLESRLSASNTRVDEARDVVSRTRDNSGSLMRELSIANENIRNLKKQNDALASKYMKLDSIVKSYESKLENANSRCKSLDKQLEKAINRSNTMKDTVSKLDESNVGLRSKVADLKSENKTLKSRLSENANKLKNLSNTNKLIESKTNNISKSLTKSVSELSEVTNKYVKSRCAQEGLDYEHVSERISKNSSIEDIDKLIAEMSDQNRRIAKVPVLLQPTTAKLTESSKPNNNDMQTIEFLQNFK